MAFGLTSDELMETFLENWQKQMSELQAQLDASVNGESPEMSQWLSDRVSRIPDVPIEYTKSIMPILSAIMDTIARNNEVVN